MDDVLTNKAQTIELCLRRINEEYAGDVANLKDNQTKQDAIILNLQRACEASIDIGMRVVRLKKLGVPQSSRDVFIMMEQAQIISNELSASLQNMVGFRNIAIHDYQKLNVDIIKSILEQRLGDFMQFIKTILAIS